MKKTYTVQDKDAAVKHFQTTENSLRECARLYGIPTMTLSENARSGFEATSIWPLDRSKISNEKTGGTNYYNEATELPLSHYTSDYFASKKNQTKQTKVVKRNNLLDEFQTILNDQRSLLEANISSAVLSVIQKAKARPERAHFTLAGHCLTADDAISQMEAKKQELENRIKEIERKKMKEKLNKMKIKL